MMEKTFDLSDNIIGIIFESKIEKQDIENLQNILKDRMERFGTVCVMIEDKNRDGISLEAMLKDLAYEFSYNTKVQKIAVVTDERWFRMITDLKSLFTPTSVESYKKKNRLDAIEWIMN